MTILDEPDLAELDFEAAPEPANAAPVLTESTWAWINSLDSGEPYTYGGNDLVTGPLADLTAVSETLEQFALNSILAALTSIALPDVGTFNSQDLFAALGQVPEENIPSVSQGLTDFGAMLEWICECTPSRHDLLTGR